MCWGVDTCSTILCGRFIYHLHNASTLPWVYGGEYDQFQQLVSQVIQAWIQLGLKIYFVFDGLYQLELLFLPPY